jgi:hypothetical protein
MIKSNLKLYSTFNLKMNLTYDTVLVDTNTISRTCYEVYDQETQHNSYSSESERAEELKKDAVRMAKHYLHLPFLNKIFCKKQIWLTDYKPYWRKFIFPEYKGNRPPITGEMMNYLEHFAEAVNALSYTHYEADDLIAAYIRLNELKEEKDQERILIASVDSDLLQLTSKNTSWICTKGYFPQLRTVDYGFSLWFEDKIKFLGKKKKEQINITNPLHIIEYKVMCGDYSDNIKMKNTSPELRRLLIDLRNPPKEYDAINLPYLLENFENYTKPINLIDSPDFYSQYGIKTNLVFPTRMYQ